MSEFLKEETDCGTFLILIKDAVQDEIQNTTQKHSFGKVIAASPKYCALTSYEEQELKNKDSLFEIFCPEDKERVCSQMRGLDEEGQEVEFHYKLFRRDASLGWHTAYGKTIQLNGGGLGLRATVFDLTYVKHTQEVLELEKERYRFLSERDSLTNLYNKASTNASIREYLQSRGRQGKHALLVIDLDEFKSINDQFGHQFGDAVLNEISKHLSRLFRGSDIIGRIGGDEFLVLMKDIPDESIVREKAAALCAIFDTKEIAAQVRQKEVRISASIGVAIYPNDGISFYKLFRKADQALYHAKNQGKNQLAFFADSSSEAQGEICATVPKQEGICLGSAMTDPCIELLCRTLARLHSSQNRLQDLLEVLGKEFALDRICIDKRGSKPATIEPLFHWCTEGKLQKSVWLPVCSISESAVFDPITRVLYLKDREDIQSQFPEFYEILKEQNIYALLQIQLEESGLHGLIRFEDCHAPHLWTKTEIECLMILKSIIQDSSAKGFLPT